MDDELGLGRKGLPALRLFFWSGAFDHPEEIGFGVRNGGAVGLSVNDFGGGAGDAPAVDFGMSIREREGSGPIVVGGGKPPPLVIIWIGTRSEERRVGKE